MENREIEVKFLEIDKEKFIRDLQGLGADDLGEETLTEQIFHDSKGDWYAESRFARIRKTSKGTFFSYKHVQQRTATGTIEIEFEINEPEKMKAFLEALGLVMDREQEKLRHKFKLGEVTVDIDTWPNIPTYVEFEGPSEEAIKAASSKFGFDWNRGVFGAAYAVILEVYKLDLRKIRYFTFDKVE